MSRCGIHMSVRSCSLRGCVALLALVSGACLGEYTIVTSQTTTQPTDAGTDASTSGGGDLGAASGSEGSDAEAGTDTAPCSDCGGSCVDLEGDPEHCGSCEVACGAGESCVDGECRSSCAGGCLEELEVCVDGACVCRPGLSACADGCFDLESDPARCGACDEACDGIPCGDGLCLPDGCPEALSDCGGACVDLESDPLHCGGCEHVCDSDELCVDSNCRDYAVSDCVTCPCASSCERDQACCAIAGFSAALCVEGGECPSP